MMKSLKPFSHTFFSEWFLSPDYDRGDDVKKKDRPACGDQSSFDDKGKAKELDVDEPWTTQWGTESGFHTGL